MSLLVSVITCDRPKILEFALRFFLGRGPYADVEVNVHDNSKGDVNVVPGIVQRIKEELGVNIWAVGPIDRVHDGSQSSANTEIGETRRVITDTFLAGRHDYLLMLDDDVLVELPTVREAISDLEALRDMSVGVIGLHPFPKRLQATRFQIRDHLFRTFDFSSEAALLMGRPSLELAGNAFGPQEKGFADTQFRAFRDAGVTCVTRISPPYRVQHVGVEGLAGTLAYKKEEKRPSWTKRLFREYLTDETIYKSIIGLWRQLGLDNLLNQLRKGSGGKMRKQQDQAVADRMVMPKGRINIEVQDKDGKTVKQVHVENLVVNNGKTIMARLLGASGSTYTITRMQFGTGTTAAAVTDTTLEVPISPTKSIETTAYPDTSSVRFTAVLDSDEANGFPVAEAALQSASQGMFSRATFGPLTKSNDFRFVFSWTIYW